jgi:GTP-binding protein
MRREKGMPLMGPCGGSGGRGGSVHVTAVDGLSTLTGVRQRIHVVAEGGCNGLGKGRDGGNAADVVVRVPVGTIVRLGAGHDGAIAGELTSPGQRLCVAKGGRGGRGNQAFRSATNRAPRLVEYGADGDERWIRLDLKLVADVGVIGLPNAGKSTLLSKVTNARPKIADYPFTTIIPNLGVCDLEDGKGLVLCDVPGLIEGAASGSGLGHRFLRHVQRNKVLLHVLDGSSDAVVADFNVVNEELRAFDETLFEKPQVVVVNKIDLLGGEEGGRRIIEDVRMAAGHTRVMGISAMDSINTLELMHRLKKFVDSVDEVVLDSANATVDLSKASLDAEPTDFDIISD